MFFGYNTCNGYGYMNEYVSMCGSLQTALIPLAAGLRTTNTLFFFVTVTVTVR